VRIGVFSDSAFTFYYPENLEALSAAGAEIVRVSGLADNGLPSNLDGLYLGGGFPETHVRQLSANEELHRQLREAAESGMPMYAECGGLIYLARSLTCEDERYPMAGVLPIEVELHPRPQGHGYVEAVVDRPNPFFPEGVALRGHEFHYTSIRVSDGDEVATALRLSRGTGALGGRDGIVYKNVLAGYTHLHALGVPLWAPSLVSRAAAYADRRAGNSTE
jgi:cobyrinic acid a,c-diamide synthase